MSTKVFVNLSFPKASHYAGDNARVIEIGDLELFFSYETLVAYRDFDDGLVVTQNRWSTTTGKHLNAIDDGNKKYRLTQMEFEAKVIAMTLRHSSENAR